ncbi:MAG: HAD-IA family hydrolase [Zavarzinella sp.]
MHPTTIVFDFGNVIGFFDHHRSVTNLTPYTTGTSEKILHALYHSPVAHDYECGRLTTSQFQSWLAKEIKLECTEQEFVRHYSNIFTRNEEICDAIPKLAGKYELVLASNTNDAHFQFFASDFADVLQYFQFLGVSHQLGDRKPAEQFFRALEEKSNLKRSTSLFVDDLQANTSVAAKLGYRTVTYEPNGTFMQLIHE